MSIKEKLKKLNRKPPGQNTKQTLKIWWPEAYTIIKLTDLFKLNSEHSK